MEYQLSELAKTTAHYINTTHQHIFLTGKAGTGKTTFLKYIVENTHKKTVVAAPTGIAAINANGVTLHSLLHLPFGAFIPQRITPPSYGGQITTLSNLFRDVRFNATKRDMLREVELLVIDEVSMLRSDLLDCIDHMLRFVRRRGNEPFGGLQILFIGDLLQLPPVVKEAEWNVLSQYYKSSYFFDAIALQHSPLLHVELDKVYRQTDENFIAILNRFRNDEQSEADIDFLNKLYQPDARHSSRPGYIHLTTHNRKADDINHSRLKELTSPSFEFKAEITGDFPESMYPTFPRLLLKKEAQVMFIKNDPSGQGKFFNGKIGQVSEIDDEQIVVKFEDGTTADVSSYTWENKRFTLNATTKEIEEKVIGTFIQFPLKLAWAVTIHKSQGLTFEKAILDLTDAFTSGQVYVALSRLTSLNGLILSSHLPFDSFGQNASMKNFLASKNDLDYLKTKLPEYQKRYYRELAKSTFNFSALIKALRDHIVSFDKEENRSAKQQFLEWTENLLKQTEPLQAVGNKFTAQVETLLQQADYLENLSERATKANDYFLTQLNSLTDNLRNHQKDVNVKSRTRSYQKELKNIAQLFFSKKADIQRFQMLVSKAAEGKSLSKNEILETSLYQKAEKSIAENAKAKTPTAEISFGLYQEGKSVEEIAEARGLVPSTIEGHLSKYIASGEVDIHHLIEKQKLDNILSLVTPETSGSTEIKNQLGDEYSYGEIRMALIYYSSLKKS